MLFYGEKQGGTKINGTKAKYTIKQDVTIKAGDFVSLLNNGQIELYFTYNFLGIATKNGSGGDTIEVVKAGA